MADKGTRKRAAGVLHYPAGETYYGRRRCGGYSFSPKTWAP